MEQKAPLSRSADGAGRTILAIVSDLLIEVRIEAAAQRQGIAIKTAMAQDAVALITDSKFALVMADLAVVSNLESLAAAAQAANVEVVAFYPHVDTDLRKAARDAGIDYVYPRSRFLRELPKILAARLQP